MLGVSVRSAQLALGLVGKDPSVIYWLGDHYCIASPESLLKICLHAVNICMFLASQYDDWSGRIAQVELSQLSTGYSGHVRDSDASVKEDRCRILNEIRSS